MPPREPRKQAQAMRKAESEFDPDEQLRIRLTTSIMSLHLNCGQGAA